MAGRRCQLQCGAVPVQRRRCGRAGLDVRWDTVAAALGMSGCLDVCGTTHAAISVAVRAWYGAALSYSWNRCIRLRTVEGSVLGGTKTTVEDACPRVVYGLSGWHQGCGAWDSRDWCAWHWLTSAPTSMRLVHDSQISQEMVFGLDAGSGVWCYGGQTQASKWSSGLRC